MLTAHPPRWGDRFDSQYVRGAGHEPRPFLVTSGTPRAPSRRLVGVFKNLDLRNPADEARRSSRTLATET